VLPEQVTCLHHSANQRVYPSAGDLATNCDAIAAFAPGLFSTITEAPSFLESDSASGLAKASAGTRQR
jgi:hypothetical protein